MSFNMKLHVDCFWLFFHPSRRWRTHLTATEQARFLQPRPNTLNATGVLGMDVCVSTHALVLQHEGVVHQPCRESEEIIINNSLVISFCPIQSKNTMKHEFALID